MTKEEFQKVVKANRFLSHHPGHKLCWKYAHGELTSFWVRRGRLYGTFSYKNPLATHPGLRLEVDNQVRVPMGLVDYVLKYFEDKGIEPPASVY